MSDYEAPKRFCTRCGEAKDLEEFGKKWNGPDGLNQWCKSCVNAYAKARYQRLRLKHEEDLRMIELARDLEEKSFRHQLEHLADPPSDLPPSGPTVMPTAEELRRLTDDPGSPPYSDPQ